MAEPGQLANHGPAARTRSGSPTSATAITQGLVWLMAVATGLVIADIYYAQPLLPFIAPDLHLSAAVAGLVVTLSQAGFAVGLVLVVPLGDLMERRWLVTGLTLAAAVAMAWLGSATNATWLLLAAFSVGLASVAVQVLVPFAASLASDDRRGRVIGVVMSGLLVGIVLARTVSGLLGELGTWRLVYFIAAGALAVLSGVLAWRLPRSRGQSALPYPRLVGSVGSLVRREPLLRLRALYGLLAAATFNTLWTAVAFLLHHQYHFSLAVIGLFGLAGAGGAVAASLAGRVADRGWANATTGIACVVLLVSWVALWAGSSILALLVVGIVVLDVGAQSLHITNQSEIYGRLDPAARSRVTSAYMVGFFVGAAAGSQLSVTAYTALGWDGTCLVGAGFSAVALVVWVATQATPALRPVGHPPGPPPARR